MRTLLLLILLSLPNIVHATTTTPIECPPGTCPANSICLEDCKTVVGCVEGYRLAGTRCVACTEYQVCQNGKVVGCRGDEYFYDERGLVGCKKCADGHICADGRLQGCMPGYFFENASTQPYFSSGCYSCEQSGTICQEGVTITCTGAGATFKCTPDVRLGCQAGYKRPWSTACFPCPAAEVCEDGKIVDCIDGYYLLNGMCRKCVAGQHICDDTTHKLVRCDTGYYYAPYTCYPCVDGQHICSDAGMGTLESCEDGYYISSISGAKKCYVCPENATCTSGKIQCNEGYFLAKSQCWPCRDERETCANGQIVKCMGLYYRDNAGTCSACPKGYYDDIADGKTKAADCKIKCDGGSWVGTKNGQCENVGIGYWIAENLTNYGATGVRNACPAGRQTIGYGTGANDADDCGHRLRFGNDYSLHLRAAQSTTPALKVEYNGDVFYGSAGTETRGHLRVEYNNQVYSIYDDSDLDAENATQ